MRFQSTPDITQNRPYLRGRWPRLMAEDICSVQPMSDELHKFSFKIVKTRLVERDRKLSGRWYDNWEEGFYYTPYVPEKEEFLGDEDFLV